MSPLPLRMIVLSALVAVGGLQSAAAGEQVSPTPVKVKKENPFAFSFLPKAFQNHPVLAISVITELTDAGRALTPPTSTKPVYYQIIMTGFHQEGPSAGDDGKISESVLGKHLAKALAESGYLPGDKEHPPTQLFNLFYGVHNRLLKADPETGEGGFVDVGYRNLLSRAALVGGAAFARDLARALEQQESGGGPSSSLLDPVYLFTNRDELTMNLMEQVLDDCYYLVISSYDIVALSKGERRLLWRTKMSTPAQGVALPDSMPALADSGSALFGREMKEPTFVGKRISGEGRVEVGPVEFSGYVDKEGTKKPDAKLAAPADPANK